jgi:hypothetical protein
MNNQETIAHIARQLAGPNGEPTLAQAILVAATGAAHAAPPAPCRFGQVDGRRIVRTLAHATLLHEGWEMDNDAWAVVLDDGCIAVVLTSHGTPYIGDLPNFRELIAKTAASLDGLRRLERIAMRLER